MVETWFAIFWFMIAGYVVLDGRNLGAAALRPFVATDAAERRQVVDAIGPLWTWHEVWLVAAGGVLLLAFPAALAAAFSGYYLALFIVLWLLVLRGVSLEVGGHVADPLWHAFWGFVLAASSATLALLLGAAFGNIVRGIPLDSDGDFHLSLFTDFGVRGDVGLLDWYTLSFGALGLTSLAAHGATYLTLKTAGPVRDRSRVAARRLWTGVAALGLVVTAETRVVRPDLWAACGARPLALAFLAVAAAGAAAIFGGMTGSGRGRDRRAFAGSCLLIAGVVATRAAASFPDLLHSTLAPENSMTAYGAAAAHDSLVSALFWWPVAIVLSVVWSILAGLRFRGRVRPVRDVRHRVPATDAD